MFVVQARIGVWLGFAEAVEEKVEEDGEDGVDEAGDGEASGEPWLGFSEQKFLYQDHDALMQREEGGGEGEAGQGMFGIETCADGGSEIADDGFGDAEEAERGFAQAILQQADESAEQ